MFSNDHRSTVSPGWQGCSSGRGRVGFASRRETRSMSAHPTLGRGGDLIHGGPGTPPLSFTSYLTANLTTKPGSQRRKRELAEVRYRPHPRPPSGAQRWSPHLYHRDSGPEVSGVVTKPLSRVPARVLPPIERSPVRFRSKGKFHSLTKDLGGGSLLCWGSFMGSQPRGRGGVLAGRAQAQLGCSRSRSRARGASLRTAHRCRHLGLSVGVASARCQPSAGSSSPTC